MPAVTSSTPQTCNSGGRSEELIGNYIADRKLRDDIVLAMKFSFTEGMAASISPERWKEISISKATDEILASLNDELDVPYSASRRPSIAPEYVLRTLLDDAVGIMRCCRRAATESIYK